jgi:hypothetical protein
MNERTKKINRLNPWRGCSDQSPERLIGEQETALKKVTIKRTALFALAASAALTR